MVLGELDGCVWENGPGASSHSANRNKLNTD